MALPVKPLPSPMRRVTRRDLLSRTTPSPKVFSCRSTIPSSQHSIFLCILVSSNRGDRDNITHLLVRSTGMGDFPAVPRSDNQETKMNSIAQPKVRLAVRYHVSQIPQPIFRHLSSVHSRAAVFYRDNLGRPLVHRAHCTPHTPRYALTLAQNGSGRSKASYGMVSV